MNDYQNILSIFDLIARGSLANAVGFTILCTSRFSNIVGLILSKTRCSPEFRLELTKFISGVMLITPAIGN